MSKSKKEVKAKAEVVPSTSPVIVAYSADKVKEGWRLVTYKIQDGKIIDKHFGEVEGKAVTLERMRLAAAAQFFIGK